MDLAERRCSVTNEDGGPELSEQAHWWADTIDDVDEIEQERTAESQGATFRTSLRLRVIGFRVSGCQGGSFVACAPSMSGLPGSSCWRLR
jgi:hypothetical protein